MHITNGGEKKIKRLNKRREIPVDGYIPAPLGTKGVIYQVLGCFWHSHLTHFNYKLKHPIKRMTFGEVYEHTVRQIKELEDTGYETRVIWECEIQNQMKQEPLLKCIYDNLELYPPIAAYSCLYGGRCETFKTLWKSLTMRNCIM